jgi:phage terminase small subunit
MALTPKQEKFCQCIVSGMSGKDSYLTAYDTKCNANTAYTEANKLLLREDIQKHIFTLRKPVEQAAQIKALNAREQQIEFIQSRIQHCLSVDDEQSIIRYTDMLNKINALYKETEQEIKPESTVNNLDISVLKRLSGVG